MLRAVSVVALMLMACAPVRADEYEAYDGALLADCLSGAGAEADAMRRCIGVSARACIDAEGGATNAYVLCWAKEADDWRTRIDVASAHLNAAHTYRDPQRLAAANAAWDAWLDAECEYWAYEQGGGVGEQVDRARCTAERTAERAISLIVAGTN